MESLFYVSFCVICFARFFKYRVVNSKGCCGNVVYVICCFGVVVKVLHFNYRNVYMFEIVKGFGNSVGWLSNILGLLVVCTPVVFAFKKRNAIMIFFSSGKYNNVKHYVSEAKLKSNAQKKIKIAVVDDEPDDFPISYLKQRGYEVVGYKSISLAESDVLHQYNIIFLDMINVVVEDKEKGAMELIKRLKLAKPSLYVIAVSKATFDPTVTDYFRLADDVEKKPIGEIRCDELISEYLSDLSVGGNAEKIDFILDKKDVPRKVTIKAVGLIVDYLDKKISCSEFSQKIDMLPANFRKDDVVYLSNKIYGELHG